VIFAIGFIVVWTLVKPLLLAWAAQRQEKARQAQGYLAKLVVADLMKNCPVISRQSIYIARCQCPRTHAPKE
jgi:hypothetical protein